MDIEAEDISIKGLFGEQNEVYKVPIYQRQYSWTAKQWDELWNDISELDDEENHFIGSIVIINEKHKKRLNLLQVVDGQQRLTTLSIMIKVLRDIFHGGTGAQKDLVATLDGYLFKKYKSETSTALVLGRLDEEIYQKILSGNVKKLPESNNLVKAYNFFYEKISSLKDPEDFMDTLLENVLVVHIAAFNHKDAFTLFETLNDRGLSLSATDLIKNNFLKCVTEEDAKKNSKKKKNHDSMNAKIDEATTMWDDMIKKIPNNGIFFLRHYFISKYSAKVSKSKLYEEYKKKIEKSKDLLGFLEELSSAATIYSSMLNCDVGNVDLNKGFEHIRDMRATTSYSLLLKLMLESEKKNVSIEEIKKIIKFVEAYSMRISTCNWSTAAMETTYIDIMKKIGDEEFISYAKKKLSSVAPKDDEFQEYFQENDYVQNDRTKYVLEQLENHIIKGTGEKNIANRQKVHIEHIMPQTITTKKSKKEFGDWVSYLGEDAKDHGEYVSLIGNLTLLGAELNITASNNPFSEKKKNYKKSNIQLTKDLCNYSRWKVKEILSRSELLAGYAIKIWKL